MICPHCGKTHLAEAEFCPITSKPLPKNINVCQYCGEKLELGIQFCPFCGKEQLVSKQGSKTLFLNGGLMGLLIIVALLALFVWLQLFPKQSTTTRLVFPPLNTPGIIQITISPTRENSTSTIQVLPSATPITVYTPLVTTLQAKSPNPSPMPGLYSDPEQFTRWYFNDVWQDRDYEYLWSFLTPSFRSYTSPGNFQEYKDWWGSVDRIDIHSFQKTQHSTSYITIRIDVTFYLKDGRVLSHRKYAYDLIFDRGKNSWMFDYR